MTLQEAIEFSTLVEGVLIDAVATPDSDFKEIMLDTFGEVDEVESNIDTLTDIAAQFVGGALNQKDFRLLVQRVLAMNLPKEASSRRAEFNPYRTKDVPMVPPRYVSASASRIVARFRAKTAAAVLPQAQRQKVNMALIRSGMDGNKPWPRLGQALNEIGEVLANNGISHDIMSADRFRGRDGITRLDIDFINEADPFSPTPITNSMLVITYHQFEVTDRWEIIAYLS